jgi:hypothetical protein
MAKAKKTLSKAATAIVTAIVAMAETASGAVLALRDACGSIRNGATGRDTSGDMSRGEVFKRIAEMLPTATVVTFNGPIVGKLAAAFKDAGATVKGAVVSFNGTGAHMNEGSYKAVRDLMYRAGTLDLVPVHAAHTFTTVETLGYQGTRNLAGFLGQWGALHAGMGLSVDWTPEQIAALTAARTMVEHKGAVPQSFTVQWDTPVPARSVVDVLALHRYAGALAGRAAFQAPVKGIRAARTALDADSARKHFNGSQGEARIMKKGSDKDLQSALSDRARSGAARDAG